MPETLEHATPRPFGAMRRRLALASTLACALAGLPSLAAAGDAVVSVHDAEVTVHGPGTFALPFPVTRLGATGDGVVLIVETVPGGSNPGVPGEDYVPLPSGTERLLAPGEVEMSVEVEAIGGADPEPDKTLLLRLTGARAYHPQPRLDPAASRFPVFGTFPGSAAVADLDADGDPDLVTGNDLSQDVSVLLNEGDGAFADAVTHSLTAAPTLFRVVVALGDVTGDGAPDIVATGFAPDVLQLFAGDGGGGFGPPTTVALGVADLPTDLALGDLDGDRDLDIVTSVGAGQHVLVSFATGGGGFAAAESFAVGSGPVAVAVADATGDGHPDVVTANANGAGNDVSVLAGDGAGGFAAAQHLSLGAAAPPGDVAVVDATGNGHADIVTANGDALAGTTASVAVLEGDGAGGFAPAVELPLGVGDAFARAVTAADVTSDGIVDLVATLPQSNAVALLSGDGTGGFAPPVRHPTPFGPGSVAIAELTGDAVADVVTANAVAASVSILPGGNGAIGFPGRFAAGSYPHAIVALDLDGSGRADVATANAQGGDVSVLLDDGTGGFAEAVAHPVGVSPTGLAAGDLDGDTIPDLISANGGSGDVSVLLGEGDGGFAPALHYSVGAGFHSPYAVAVGDVDEDGHLDVATANVNIQNESVTVLIGDGAGGFAPPIMLSVGAGFHSPQSIALADATGDDHLDIVTANIGSSDLSLLVGDGDGGFAPPVHLTADAGPVVARVDDVDGDGNPDLVALNHTAQSASVLRGDGAGNFAPAVTFPIFDLPPSCGGDGVCPWAWGLETADVNGDGRPDIVTANTGNDTVSVLPNDGAGNFAAVTSLDTGAQPGSLAVADLTGDGNADIVTANRENTDVAVLPNGLSGVALFDDEALGTIHFEPPLFADDFESGDAGAWSQVVE